VAIVTRYEAEGLSRDEAIEKAVYNCVRNGIMKTYLEAQGAEVINMLITEFDMDEYVEVVREEYREIGRDEGRVEGLAKGREDERFDIARNLKSMKCDVAMISDATGLTVDEIEKIDV
jgi:predicted transposase/invertase (TIGR01784 family)